MSERMLLGRRVLVAEDEYFIAEELRGELQAAGADVLGPVPSVAQALALAASEPGIDAAVLDLNLRGERAFPVADALAARGVPFLFATGYDQLQVPERFARVPRCEKPVDIALVVAAVGRMLRART